MGQWHATEVQAALKAVLPPVGRLQQEHGGVAGQLAQFPLGPADGLGLIHDVDQVQPQALKEIMSLPSL